MAYFLLVDRPADAATFAPQFGDRDRECVKEELASYREADKREGRKVEYKILTCKSARRCDNDAALAALNAKAAR